MVSQVQLAVVVAASAAAAAVTTVDAFVVPPISNSAWTRPAHQAALARMQMEKGESSEYARQLFVEQRHLPNLIDMEEILSTPPSMEEAEHAHGMPWTSTIGKSEMEDPLLYMPFWEWQMDFMKSSLTNLRVCQKEMTPEQAFRDNKDKKARIVSHCYQSDEYRKIRMTYYDAGDNTQVFNAVFYPRPEYNLPVLGIDLLAFNRQRYLAIVDFQPLHDEGEEGHETKFEHLLEPIRDSYESLKGRMSSKFYDETKFFSKQMLFARFEDSKVVMRDLFPAFQDYVTTHLSLFQETQAKPSQAVAILARQKAYDTYSAQRDPATGLFAAMFGAEWADNFVYDFLFSMSDRPTEEELEAIKVARKAGGHGGPPPSTASGPPPQQQTTAPPPPQQQAKVVSRTPQPQEVQAVRRT